MSKWTDSGFPGTGTLVAMGYAELDTDLRGEVELTVGEGDTAIAQGSGDVPVLATPRLVAAFEEAAVGALADKLPDDLTSVGATVEVDHLAPSAVGATVTVTALLEAVDGPALEFILEATEGGTVIATGSHTRVVVEREGFLESATR